ncbi:MAG TPA: MFS transporter [Thermoanaerobaculia bacterium]|nr:MFS transporter [Thermoanaerobaculia bacterium]
MARTLAATGRFPRLILFFTVFLDLAGFGMILPLLPFYAQRYGATPFDVGALFACYSLAQAFCAPLLGRLSDRWGRRPVLLVAIAVNVLALLLFAGARSFLALFLARTLSGVAAANFSIAQAYVADVTSPNERVKGLGMVGAALGMGFVLGPGLGGLLSMIGQVAVPLGAAVLAAGNLLLVAGWLPESLPGHRRSAFRGAPWLSLRALVTLQRPLPGLLGLFFVVLFAFSTMEATLALYCEARFGFGVAETSVLLVLVGLVIAGVQGGLVGRLVPRFGERGLVVAGIVAMAGGLLLMPLAPLVPLLAVPLGLLAVGSGIHQPALLGLVSQLASEEAQGRTLGLSRSMGALARTAGPLWGGWTFQTLGPAWPFWTAGVVMAGALAWAWMVVGSPPQQERAASEA